MLRCPHCHDALTAVDNRFDCPNGHSFDLARQGYVNLLPSSAKRSKNPGDTDAMLVSRRAVLDEGHYAPFRDYIAEQVAAHVTDGAVVLDVGCGEGYYTDGVRAQAARMGKMPVLLGIDIAKSAVRMAAAKYKGCTFAVASSHDLPVPSASVSVLMNVFSPIDIEEMVRVLAPGGVAVIAGPGPSHLDAVRDLLYEETMDHPSTATQFNAQFRIVEQQTLTHSLNLQPADFTQLVHMTPYWWHAREHLERVGSEPIEITVSFEITTLERS